MGCKIRIIHELITLHLWRALNESQDSGYVPVYCLLAQSPVSDGICYGLYLVGTTRHYKVITGLYGCYCIAATAPIGHYHTFKSPLLTQDVLYQSLILGGISAVNLVVRCHYCPRL